MMSVQAFYDELAPLYHLVYEDWEATVARQGQRWHRSLPNTGERTRARCWTLRWASVHKRSGFSQEASVSQARTSPPVL